MNIIFQNILIVSPLDKLEKKLNLWLKDGVIIHCSPEFPIPDNETKIIKADELVCFPGLFDMHVHLREPGQEYKETIETGTNSAANGGFTSVVCMPNTNPTIDNLPVVEYIRTKSINLLADVFCCGAITKNRAGKDLAPMLELLDNGVVMFSDDGGAVRSAEVMRRAFDYVSTFDGLLTQHCEEHSLTESFSMNEGQISAKLGLKGYPSVAEDIIVARDILLADYCGNRRYHAAHLSTKGAVRLVHEAKIRGQRISCEVAPHHFVLTDEAVLGYNTNAKMNPPLRTQADIDAILLGLSDGTIDCIATDHAPHAHHEKECEFALAANGITGLETSLGLSLTYLYHTGILTLSQLAEKMSVRQRKILQLPDIHIQNGEPANLTIFAPNEEWTVDKSKSKSKSKNTPFDAYELKGKPKFAINNGKIWESDL